MSNQITYKRFGENAILMEWKAIIDVEILQDILSFKTKIETLKDVRIIDVIQGYNSLTILFNEDNLNFDLHVSRLQTLYTSTSMVNNYQRFQWEIPVCYDVIFGIDLKDISKKKKIDIRTIIKLHSEAVYTVYFIGFLPGFLYLGGLNAQLFMNRKQNPRLNVTKGSVGIGGKQTGVYPNNSAGGWNIIGKTPVSFFDVEKETPCFANAGDSIKFKPISLDEFYNIENEILKGKYKLNKTLHNA